MGEPRAPSLLGEPSPARGLEAAPAGARYLRSGDVEVALDAVRVCRGGRWVHLAPIELRVLCLLLTYRDRD